MTIYTFGSITRHKLCTVIDTYPGGTKKITTTATVTPNVYFEKEVIADMKNVTVEKGSQLDHVCVHACMQF